VGVTRASLQARLHFFVFICLFALPVSCSSALCKPWPYGALLIQSRALTCLLSKKEAHDKYVAFISSPSVADDEDGWDGRAIFAVSREGSLP
jgi:hypothetical protein